MFTLLSCPQPRFTERIPLNDGCDSKFFVFRFFFFLFLFFVGIRVKIKGRKPYPTPLSSKGEIKVPQSNGTSPDDNVIFERLEYCGLFLNIRDHFLLLRNSRFLEIIKSLFILLRFFTLQKCNGCLTVTFHDEVSRPFPLLSGHYRLGFVTPLFYKVRSYVKVTEDPYLIPPLTYPLD